jgi:hypothetical protein
MVTPLEFEPKFDFFKTHKHLYTTPLSITDLKYVFHDQEIQSFCQILPQASVFR